MHETDMATHVDDHLSGHPAKFEEVYLLSVLLENLVIGIRQAHKRQIVLEPICLEGVRFFRTDNKNDGLSFYKQIMVLAQLRHVPAAERSQKTTIENQYDVSFISVVGKTHGTPGIIGQRKFGCFCIERDLLRHCFLFLIKNCRQHMSSPSFGGQICWRMAKSRAGLCSARRDWCIQ